MPPETRRRKRTNLFTKDLRALLYAYGDVMSPYPETIAVLEDILEEYITSICLEAYRVARAANRQKLKVDDFKFALRHDPKKLGRVEELLLLQKEIETARKQIDNSEGKLLSKTYDEKDEKEDREKEQKKEREDSKKSKDKDKDKDKDTDKDKDKDSGDKTKDKEKK